MGSGLDDDGAGGGGGEAVLVGSDVVDGVGGHGIFRAKIGGSKARIEFYELSPTVLRCNQGKDRVGAMV